MLAQKQKYLPGDEIRALAIIAAIGVTLTLVGAFGIGRAIRRYTDQSRNGGRSRRRPRPEHTDELTDAPSSLSGASRPETVNAPEKRQSTIAPGRRRRLGVGRAVRANKVTDGQPR